MTGSNTPKRLATLVSAQKDGLHIHLHSITPLSMPSKLPAARPIFIDTTYPPMPTAPPQASTFLDRVYDVAHRWIQREWDCLQAIKRAADARTSEAVLAAALRDTRLTSATLAKHLDNMSVSSLKRELAKHGAPPPGQLIRVTRIRFAMHLLLHTRLKIHHVALRAGYSDPEHFAAVFKREVKCAPHVYRRNGGTKPKQVRKMKPTTHKP
jgi:AraC-like DNA-binding protein